MAAYQIRVRGVVTRLVQGLPDVDMPVSHETVLHADPQSPDELYALIERLYSLGLELVEVRAASRQADGAAVSE